MLIRAKPPAGYVLFKMKGETANDIVCPNCKKKGGGWASNRGGFQDKEAKMISRAMDRLIKKGLKNSYDAFCVKVENDIMLKCHPSRFGEGHFMCCNCKIWHDFGDDTTGNQDDREWRYYYQPTGAKSLLEFL